MNISIASFIFSAFSLLVSAFSVFYGMTLKSYEILINKRMQTYQEIKECFQTLRGLTKIYEIEKYREQGKVVDYCQQLRNKYNQLESLLSQTDPPEFHLMQQVQRLIEMAIEICKTAQQCNSILDEFMKESKVTFLFADIYCWTLWLYVQGLHKLTCRFKSYGKLFDKNFKKVYKNAKYLHGNSHFFKRYSLKELLGKSNNPSIQEKYREEKLQFLLDFHKKLFSLKDEKNCQELQLNDFKERRLQVQEKLKTLTGPFNRSRKKECTKEIEKLDSQISDLIPKLEKIDKDILGIERYINMLKVQMNI